VTYIYVYGQIVKRIDILRQIVYDTEGHYGSLWICRSHPKYYFLLQDGNFHTSLTSIINRAKKDISFKQGIRREILPVKHLKQAMTMKLNSSNKSWESSLRWIMFFYPFYGTLMFRFRFATILHKQLKHANSSSNAICIMLSCKNLETQLYICG
jgi:hypothetical protein